MPDGLCNIEADLDEAVRLPAHVTDLEKGIAFVPPGYSIANPADRFPPVSCGQGGGEASGY